MSHLSMVKVTLVALHLVDPTGWNDLANICDISCDTYQGPYMTGCKGDECFCFCGAVGVGGGPMMQIEPDPVRSARHAECHRSTGTTEFPEDWDDNRRMYRCLYGNFSDGV